MSCCPHPRQFHASRGCVRCGCRVTALQLDSSRRHTPACTVTADVSSGYGVARCSGEHRLVRAHRDVNTGAWFAPPDEPVVDESLTCDGAGCTRLPGHDGDHRPARRSA